MPQFYHVNHGSEVYRSGYEIELLKTAHFKVLLNEPHVQIDRKWDIRFPTGLSLWGYRAISGGLKGQDVLDREHECEECRYSHFPSLPSRFQSFFALETLPEAVRFTKTQNADMQLPPTIWVVEAAGLRFRGDMNHLRRGRHTLETFQAYWRGEPAGADPVWEWLLVPSVTLIKKVNEAEIAAALDIA